MGNLTKRALADRLSQKIDLPTEQILRIIDYSLIEIADSLASGETIEFRNCFVLTVKMTKARIGRNMADPSKSVKIPPRPAVKFRAGKALRERLMASHKDKEKANKRVKA